MTTTKEGLLLILDSEGNVTGFYRKDPKTHQNILYSAKEMSMEDIEGMYRE